MCHLNWPQFTEMMHIQMVKMKAKSVRSNVFINRIYLVVSGSINEMKEPSNYRLIELYDI